ncbi:MAG: phage tail assembly protein [Methylotenera sp.]|nr:phage tail assembly protein [Methylotenera sp.]
MQKLTLKYPLKLSDKLEITELKFRDYATAQDLLAFDERGANKQTITLIANLTGNDEAVISKLHVADFRAADAICSKMLAEDATEKNVPES